MTDLSDLELLDALGVDIEQDKASARSPRDERIIAGFEGVQRFVEQHGRKPEHGEGGEIFERIYAVRLDRLRSQADCRTLLEPLDRQGLLSAGPQHEAALEPVDDDELLAQLGVTVDATNDLTDLRHVRSTVDRRAAEDIANRELCKDFEKFKPLFEQVQKDLETGLRQTTPFAMKAEIQPGHLFIVGGQKAYVAEMGEVFSNAQGRTDARLRVIFDNGTESNLLMRSLQRALHKDDAGRRISDPVAGPLFTQESEDGDEASGTIYVLRSKSSDPTVVANRAILHKIGVTGGSVERRIANARIDPTFLMADVEIVATYELFNISRARLENVIHRIFGAARLDIEIKDRFGNPIIPREWFLVPRFVIDEAIEKIRDGTIAGYAYDPKTGTLRQS